MRFHFGLRARIFGVLLAAVVAFELTQLVLLGWDVEVEGPRSLLAVSLPALGVSLLVAAVGVRLLARDLRQLLHRLRRLARGPEPGGAVGDEIPRMMQALDRLGEDLARSTAALAGEKGRLEAVLGGMRDAVLALDQTGRVSLANPAAVSLLGRGGSPVGRTLFELTRAAGLAELASDALLGRAGSREIEIRRPGPEGGVLRTSRVLATATPQDGGGCVFVIRDVTELRRLETARRDFVANVSHEIRTPIAIVRASAEALAQGGLDDPEAAQGFVHAILRHAERLSALVEDMLSLSRIEAGRVELHPEELDLAVEVGAAILAVEPRALARRQELALDVPEELTLVADTRALEHVLTNLLDNAIKYTPEGGHVRVRARTVQEGVRVEVIDDGPGVPPAHRERLFERFYRVDSGRSRELGGTGLGLAIVKHLVEAMGGRVGMEPAHPSGSIFWVILPKTPAPAERRAVGSQSSPA